MIKKFHLVVCKKQKNNKNLKWLVEGIKQLPHSLKKLK